MESISKLIKSTSIGSIAKLQPDIFAVEATDSVESVLNFLSNKNITGVPVFDQSVNRYIGFVDVLDLVVYVLSIYVEVKTADLLENYKPGTVIVRFQAPIKKVIDASKQDPYFPINYADSTAILMKAFTTGIHRLPVSLKGSIVGLISQSDVVRFLYKNKEQFKEIFKARAVDLLPPTETVLYTVKSTDPLILAFHKIVQTGITGIAVVTEGDGQLIGNISASDLKGLTPEVFNKLDLPIDDLLQDAFYKLPPVFVYEPNGSLEDVIERMITKNVHRVFLVDLNLKPKYVITMTTIMKIFDKLVRIGATTTTTTTL